MTNLSTILMDGQDVDMSALRSWLYTLAGSISLAALGIPTLDAVTDLPTPPGDSDSKTVFINNDPDSDNNTIWTYPDGGPWRKFTEFYEGMSAIVQPLVDLAKAWAQSDTNPDPADPTSKSAKTSALEAAASAATALTAAGVNVVTNITNSAVIGGAVDATGCYTEIRTSSLDVVTIDGSRNAALAASATVSIGITASTGPIGGSIDLTGCYTRAIRASDSAIPGWFGPAALARSLQIGKTPLQVADKARALFASSILSGAADAGSGNAPYYRIPMLYSFSLPSSGGSAPRRRIIAIAQARVSNGGDSATGGIVIRHCDPTPQQIAQISRGEILPNALDWSAEQNLVTTSANWHVDNVSMVFDPATGCLEFLGTMVNTKWTEQTVPAPNNASASDGSSTKVFSFRSSDPFDTLSLSDQAGGALAYGFAPETATIETNARDGVTPYWNVSPGSPGLVSSSTTNNGSGELLIAGNAAGTAGGAGSAPIATTGFAFLYYKDKTQPAGQQWKWRMPTDLGLSANESAIIQRRDGSIMLDSRNGASTRARGVVVSDPSVSSWGAYAFDVTRPDPGCEGSMHVLSGGARDEVPVLLALNLRDAISETGLNRKYLTVYVSNDEGRTWSAYLQLYPATASVTVDSFGTALAAPETVTAMNAYSSVCRLSGDSFLVLFENVSVNADGTSDVNTRVISMLALNLASIYRSLLP